jgi:PAS domain S-box-containing protein
MIDRMHPDDRDAMLARMRQVEQGEKIPLREMRVAGLDGREVYVEAYASRVTYGGSRAVQVILRDITERKKAEVELRESRDKYQALIETTNDFIWEMDPAGRYTYCSPQMEKLWGVKPADMIGKTPFDVMLETQKKTAARAFFEMAKSPGPFNGFESVARLGDGRLIHVETSGVPFFDADGKLLGFRGISRDITARKKAEESLRLAKEELELRVLERTRELAVRADQLRSMAGELTMVEQRERRRLANVLHDHLQQLLVAAKFGLTALGKSGSGKQINAVKEVEGVIDEAIASSRSLTAELSPPILHDEGLNAGFEWLVRRWAKTQGLSVKLETEEIGVLPDDLTILLFQSVRELLFNVVKHSQTRLASIAMRRIDGSLRVSVSDQGIGFDPKTTSSPGEAGRGFGLFSVRERLELFGGRMEIESAPGRGSRVTLLVPITMAAQIVPRAAEIPAMPKDSALPAVPEPVGARKIRLLLADDHAVVRQGIANLLSAEPDMEIIGTAADGKEAVALASKQLPDVILMDMNMPNLNGVEATRIVHINFPDIRIIGLSMFEEAEKAQAMRDAGAAHYLTKSGPADELIKAIRAVAGHSSKDLSSKAR